MIKKTSILAILFVMLSTVYVNNAAAISADDKSLALRLFGTGNAYEMNVPGLEEPALCFDVDLMDIKTNEVIGTATDCLSQLQPQDDGLSILGTTYFYLPDGFLAIRGDITARAVLEETTLKNFQQVSHITGAASPENAVIDGSGPYENITGTIRLSGMVEMSEFNQNEGDPITFDCLFFIDID